MKNNFKSGRGKSWKERLSVTLGLLLVGVFFLNSLLLAGAEKSGEERRFGSGRIDLNLLSHLRLRPKVYLSLDRNIHVLISLAQAGSI